MVIEEKQKNGAQLFFTSNIENYIIEVYKRQVYNVGIDEKGGALRMAE